MRVYVSGVRKSFCDPPLILHVQEWAVIIVSILQIWKWSSQVVG